ncbi:hypothetical protein J4E81_008699 [Alternaria sp. BMP 2799]|nr:hypothetical protein J4E81_008699 [Alternaria sp. BMP 2799]
MAIRVIRDKGGENRFDERRRLGQQEERANVESEKRIALTVGQEENKKKNRRKQIYVQQVSQQSLPGSAQLISPPLSGSALSGYTSTTGSPGGSAICMGNMDPEIVGMDFVLTYFRFDRPRLDGLSMPLSSSPFTTWATTVLSFDLGGSTG